MRITQTTQSRRTLRATALASLIAPRLPAKASEASMRIRCSFSDQQFTCRLLDNPTTRDLISMLPLGLTIEDFSTSEKLAHLPRRLDEGGVAPLLVRGSLPLRIELS